MCFTVQLSRFCGLPFVSLTQAAQIIYHEYFRVSTPFFIFFIFYFSGASPFRSRSDVGCSPRSGRAEAGTGLCIRLQALGHKRLQAGLRTGSSGLRGLSAPVKAVPRGRPGHSPRSGRAEAGRVYPFRCIRRALEAPGGSVNGQLRAPRTV